MRGGGGAGADQSTQALGLAELYLRLSVVPLVVASLWLMATDRQVPRGYGKMEYSHVSGFTYLVYVNAISAGYALVSAPFSRHRGNFTADWAFYACDQVIAYLLLTSGSAAAEVLILAYMGSRKSAWSEACSYYGRFCSRAKVSLLLQLPALICFVALAVISAFRVFSKFEAPCTATTSPPLHENGEVPLE